MKTIKKTVNEKENFKRVSDSLAHNLVVGEGWEYTSKQEWKQKVRDKK